MSLPPEYLSVLDTDFELVGMTRLGMEYRSLNLVAVGLRVTVSLEVGIVVNMGVGLFVAVGVVPPIDAEIGPYICEPWLTFVGTTSNL